MMEKIQSSKINYGGTMQTRRFYVVQKEFSPTVTDIDAFHLTATFPQEMWRVGIAQRR